MENQQTEFDKAYTKAIKLIKIRPHGSGEIKKKLLMRRFNAGIIEQVTKTLIEQGLIDDEQFQEGFIDSLVRFKTFGFYGILAKLLSRGISKAEAEALLKEKLSLETEKEIAQKVIDKDRTGDKVKVAQKLSRKGFRSQVISELIRELSED